MDFTNSGVTTNAAGREMATHGTEAFPSGFYESDLSFHPLPWHWHDEIELLVLTKGAVRFKTLSDEFVLKEGEGLFFNSGVLHAAWENDAKEIIIHSIVFHPRLIGGYEGSIFWDKYLNPLMADPSLKSMHFSQNISWQKEILRLIEDSWQAGFHKKNEYEFDVRANLSHIVALLLSKNNPSQLPLSEKQLRDNQRIKLMLQYIEEHLSDSIEITDIADTALISVSECLRCFKHSIGTTPIQYVKQLRIQKAAELLSSTTLSITEVAIECGFQEMSYFSKTFKQTHGCTPSEYRDQKRNG